MTIKSLLWTPGLSVQVRTGPTDEIESPPHDWEAASNASYRWPHEEREESLRYRILYCVTRGPGIDAEGVAAVLQEDPLDIYLQIAAMRREGLLEPA